MSYKMVFLFPSNRGNLWWRVRSNLGYKLIDIGLWLSGAMRFEAKQEKKWHE